MVPRRPGSIAPPRARGGDALDGAVAGWLLVSAAHSAGAVGEGGLLASAAAFATTLVLAGAVVPFLRFAPAGWWLAASGISAHALQAALRADWSGGARALAVLLPNLLTLGYLAWVRGGWLGRSTASVGESDRPSEADAPRGPVPVDEVAAAAGIGTAPLDDRDPPASAAPAPDPAAALAAIHRRITSAGSACALAPADALAEAERHGLGAAGLRREGLALYRTFREHFAAAGPVTPREERELACLAALLELDPRAAGALTPTAPIDAGVPLEPGERCLAARQVELYRVPANGGGADGLHLDPLAPARDLAGLVRAGACRLVVTDRRLLLVAPSGQQSPLPLERISRAAAYANGVEIRPRRGPALFVRMDAGVAETARAIHRAASPFHDTDAT